MCSTFYPGTKEHIPTLFQISQKSTPGFQVMMPRVCMCVGSVCVVPKGHRAHFYEESVSILAPFHDSSDTVHVTRAVRKRKYAQYTFVGSATPVQEHSAYSLGTRANLILLSSSSSWSMTRATGYIWSKSKWNCTPAGGSRRKFLLSLDEKGWKTRVKLIGNNASLIWQILNPGRDFSCKVHWVTVNLSTWEQRMTYSLLYFLSLIWRE